MKCNDETVVLDISRPMRENRRTIGEEEVFSFVQNRLESDLDVDTRTVILKIYS